MAVNPKSQLVDVGGRSIDPHAQLLDLDRTECEDSLYEFLKQSWKFMDGSPFTDGWHIGAIAEHLEAIVDGQIKRLMIHMPPRHGKSLLLSVAFPAWVWAQEHLSHTSGAGVPFLFASYADKLSLRDSVKCRRLIESPFYQHLFGSRFTLTSDNNTKSRFSNSAGGERLITSIGAGVTGEGGNIICIDDPNAANEMESDATTQATIDWWTQALSTRTNDPDKSAIVLIQQRLRENDLSGYIMDNEFDGWTHLCLPGRMEMWRKPLITTIGWQDPRETEGELLWPQRFSEQSLKNLERTMGPFIFAGQIQQRPEPAGGGIVKRDWWLLWERETYPAFDYICAMVDTAYTLKTENDPSAMIVWGVFSPNDVGNAQLTKSFDRKTNRTLDTRKTFEVSPRAFLMYAWRERLEFHELVKKVAQTAERFKCHMVMIENKAAGISLSQEIRRLYQDERFALQLFDPKSQDKMARLYSVQHLFSEGLIFAPDRPWADMVVTEVGQFPKGKRDDLTDCVSMGLRHLRDSGLLARSIEVESEQESLIIYPGGKETPLYNC
jgi:predicted phage terminase large subunit-like protein